MYAPPTSMTHTTSRTYPNPRTPHRTQPVLGFLYLLYNGSLRFHVQPEDGDC